MLAFRGKKLFPGVKTLVQYQTAENTKTYTDLKKQARKHQSTTSPSPLTRASSILAMIFSTKCPCVFSVWMSFYPLYQKSYFEALTFHLCETLLKLAEGQMYNCGSYAAIESCLGQFLCCHRHLSQTDWFSAPFSVYSSTHDNLLLEEPIAVQTPLGCLHLCQLKAAAS